MKRILTALPFLVPTMTVAHAHGMWLAEHAGALAVVYGVGPQDDSYSPEKVKTVTAWTSGGEVRPAKIVKHDTNAVIDTTKDAAVIATTMDNGYWTKGPDGKVDNVPKSAVPGAVSTDHTLKFNTFIRGSTGGKPKPTGATLEIVPLVDPYNLKPGAKLPVQVLFEGKPLANAALCADYVNDGNSRNVKTDADGKATLVVKNDGLNVVDIEHEKLTQGDKDVDKMIYAATLSYVIAFTEAE